MRREQGGVEPACVGVGEHVIGELFNHALGADKRAGAGGEVQVTRAVAGAVAEQGLHRRGERGVIHRGDHVERDRGQTRRRLSGGYERGRSRAGRGTGSGDAWSWGNERERIVGGRARLGFGQGEAGNAFEHGVIFDVAVVDELLREVHQVGAVAELAANGFGLLRGDQVLVKAEADKPTDLILHGRKAAGAVRRSVGVGKAEPSAKPETFGLGRSWLSAIEHIQGCKPGRFADSAGT